MADDKRRLSGPENVRDLCLLWIATRAGVQADSEMMPFLVRSPVRILARRLPVFEIRYLI
jgi:hypothetical protein